MPSLLGIRLEDWAFALTIGAICGALTLLGITLTTGPERVAAIWPMNAFVVALLVRRDRTVWPGLLAAAALGNVIVNLYTGNSWPVALALCVANVLEIFACAYAFKRLAGPRAVIAEPRPLFLFLGIAMAAPVVPALIAGIALTALEGASFYAVLWHWYAADVLGLLIFTPALLAVDWHRLGKLTQATSRDGSMLSFPALCLVVLYVFAQSHYPFLFLIAPVLIFIAFRFGMAGTALGILLTAIIATTLTVLGHGPTQLINGAETEKILVLQAFLAFTSLSTLPVAAALTQNARARTGLEDALREVEQADAMRAAGANARPQSDDIADVTLCSLASGDSGKSFAINAAPKVVAVAIGVLGIAVLFGWLLGIESLKTVLPNYESMKPITAVNFILSAIVLYLSAPEIRGVTSGRARTVLSVLILVPSALTLASFAFPIRFYIDELLTAALPGLPEDAMHRMSLVTALEFALFAAAMFLPLRRLGDQAFIVLTFVGMLLSLLVFAGYLYDLPILYAPIPASSIAVHTAVAFFVLFVAAAMTRPHTGWVTLLSPQCVTGAFAPWLLPTMVILPIAFGWVLNEAIKNSVITPQLGVDLFALSTVFFLTVVAWRTGVIANRLGRHLELREQLELRLREARVAAEDAAAAKSDFLANMSHELRTPLNSIIGFAGLLSKSSTLRPKDRRYIEIVDEFEPIPAHARQRHLGLFQSRIWRYLASPAAIFVLPTP